MWGKRQDQLCLVYSLCLLGRKVDWHALLALVVLLVVRSRLCAMGNPLTAYSTKYYRKGFWDTMLGSSICKETWDYDRLVSSLQLHVRQAVMVGMCSKSVYRMLTALLDRRL